MEIFQLCTGSLWRIFTFSDIYNIGIMPGDRYVWGCHVKSPKVNIARYAGL